MEKKEDMFKYHNSNEVTIYSMKNKARFLILTIFILIVTSTLRYKYKVEAYRFVELIMLVDMVLIFGAIASGLWINNTIKISKDFIKIGSLKPIEWKNINKIGFQAFSGYRGKSLNIVIYTKDSKERITRNIGVISNKENLKEQIKFFCNYYDTQYFNHARKKFFKEWWHIF